ncbi:MAG: hypothetical protein ACYC3V_02685 [Chloroflexota bacterium]
METLLGPLVAVGLWLGLLVFFRAHRIWLPYYALGSVGLATAIIYFGRGPLPLETWLKTITGIQVHQLMDLVGVPTRLFEGVPGALMVLVISQEIGWTVLHIDIECSGLLESAVLVGLLAFYPAWSLGKKLTLMAIGLAATYLANLARLVTIIAVLHWGGKDTLFMSHTVVGRAVFFAIVVLVYWFLLTRPTIETIRHRLGRGVVG